jgi:hypothetical protein
MKKFKAIDLLTPKRFDINAKLFYAKYKNYNSEYPKKVYLNHIKSWNNFFEKSPRKTSPEDFVDSFNKLLLSIKEKGFTEPNKNYVPLKNNSPYNGAHRVAACILHNKEIYGKEDQSNGQYDCGYKHFQKLGLDRPTMDTMSLEYISNKSNLYTVTLFASDNKNLNVVEEILNKYSEIVYEKDVDLTPIGKLNYTIELYRDEKWIGSKTTNYDGAKYKSDMCFQNSNKMRVYLIETNSPENLVTCKKEIRDVFRMGNHSVHINDTQEETWRIATTVFNDNSLFYINNVSRMSNEKLLGLLKKYNVLLNNKNKNLYCITSSVILTMYGLTDCNDLDFLTLDPTMENFNDGEIGSHDSQLRYYSYFKDEIILNPELYFYFGGLKFCIPEIVYKMKLSRNEEKDKIHVNKLENLIKKI